MKQLTLLLLLFTALFSKTFSVSYDPDYAPFSYEVHNKAQGLLIDIWKLWAKENNYKIKFVKAKTWDEAIDLAKEGKVDFFLGTTPYEDWMKASVAYYKTKTSLFVLDSFNSNPKVIGIIGEDYKEDLIKHLKNIKVVSFDTYEELFQSLKNKQIDALYDDYLAIVYFAIKHNYNFIKKLNVLELKKPVQAISNNEENIKIFNEGFRNIPRIQLKDVIEKWDNLAKIKKTTLTPRIVFYIFLLLFIVVLIFVVINHRLKSIIAEKTEALQKLNKELEYKIAQRTKELEIEKNKAQRYARAKSMFLANMSHEIRTPLNSILGFITLLKDEDLNPSARNYINIIEKSSKSLLSIINDILDLSKIEEKKISIENVEFNLEEEVETIVQLFYSIVNEKNITLKVNKINTNHNIISDPTRIKQVITNLLSNAIKFTPNDKKVELNIEYDMKNALLKVSVIDEGIGIDSSHLNKIFEAFSQADDSTTREYGGTGLGLSISSSLVKLLGGELKVESEINKGSRFYFTIPVKAGNDFHITKEKEKIIISEFDCNVLLAEDNKANQMFMKVILKKLGLKVDIANDGIEVFEIYKNNYKKYDLILMDENMPNMNGIEATKEIRKFEEKNNLKSIMIIALTANALHGDKERFILAGMNYYLSKPLDIDKLKEILNKVKR